MWVHFQFLVEVFPLTLMRDQPTVHQAFLRPAIFSIKVAQKQEALSGHPLIYFVVGQMERTLLVRETHTDKGIEGTQVYLNQEYVAHEII